MSRSKPDFSGDGCGFINPELFTASVRSELFLHLHSAPLTAEQKHALVEFSWRFGQMVLDGDTQPGRQQRAQIESIETNARRLLASLSSLNAPALQSLNAHVEYLAGAGANPVNLSPHIRAEIKADGSLLSSAWDWIEALEKSATYASEQFELDTTTKPDQIRARGFVAMLAQRILDMTGTLPPKDQATWFASFVGCLGEHLKMDIGPRIVQSGIESIR